MTPVDIRFAEIETRIRRSNGGVELAEAARDMGRLAKSGYAPALNNYGTLLQYGRGVKENLIRARQHYQAAARNGLAEAEFNLGFMWLEGLGGAKDAKQAFTLFSRAAASSETDALTHLGRMYLLGEGVESDTAQGVAAWESGARLGDSRCAYNLGSAFAGGQIGAGGQSAEADLQSALGWFYVAKALGNAGAESAIEKLKPVMISDEIDGAEDFFADWIAHSSTQSGRKHDV